MDEIEIEVFRADTRASRGITSRDIAELAEAYDPETNPAPLVIGHPKDDSPSEGVVSKFRAEGNVLFATLKDVSDKLVDKVKNSEIINRSMAFFSKSHEANPTPGKLAPRHLGFLGGSAPGIPGMSSLKKALSFSAEGDILVVDGDPADAIIFEAAGTPVLSVQEEFAAMPGEKTAEEIAAANEAEAKRLADERADLEAKQQQFAADQEKAKKTAAEARVDTLVAAGKVLPANRDALAMVFGALSDDELEFSADDKGTAADKLASIIASGPALVDTTGKQLSPKDKFSSSTGNAEADAQTIDAKARKLMEETPGLSFQAAVEQVSEEA
jgi:hypothetical protein